MKLSLKVVPGSSRDETSGWLDDSLKIRVHAAAESGKADAAVIRIHSATLQPHKRAITILAGTSSTRKTVEISGLTEAEVYARLEIDNE